MTDWTGPGTNPASRGWTPEDFTESQRKTGAAAANETVAAIQRGDWVAATSHADEAARYLAAATKGPSRTPNRPINNPCPGKYPLRLITIRSRMLGTSCQVGICSVCRQQVSLADETGFVAPHTILVDENTP